MSKQNSTIIILICLLLTEIAKAQNYNIVPNAGADSSYQKSGVINNLPVFYPHAKERLTFPSSWMSGSYDDFDRWRVATRALVIKLFMAKPPHVPFNPVILNQEDRGDYMAKKVAFNISADSRVLGYLLIPKGDAPFPAVLLMHDHGAKFDIGKEKMVRPFHDTAEQMASAEEWKDKLYGGRYIGDELAKRGYVCFITDALNWGDRGGAGYEGQQALAANLLNLGMSYAGLIAHEDMSAARFLATLPEVDHQRIAAIGLSLGAFRAWQVAAVSDDINAAVCICWMSTISGLMEQGNNQTRGQSAFTMIHPGLFNYLDYPDVASIACPKPMLFYNGEKDHLFPVPAVKDAYQKLRAVWASQHAESRLVTRLWQTGHEFSLEMQEEAFNWLDSQMNDMKD